MHNLYQPFIFSYSYHSLGKIGIKIVLLWSFFSLKNNQYKPFYFLFTAVILLMVCLHMWRHFFNVDFFRDQQILWHYQTQNPVDCISYSLWWTGNFCHRKMRFGRARGGKRRCTFLIVWFQETILHNFVYLLSVLF